MNKKLILILIFIFLLAPIWFMITGSLQDIYGVMKMPPKLFPNNITFANYTRMLDWPIATWGFNTFLVVIFSALLSIIIHYSAGYAFAIYQFPLKRILWAVLISAMMIPKMSLLIPLYIIIRKLGLSSTLAAVVFTSIYSPISLYLTRNYLLEIPKSAIEAARIDGASELQILFLVIFPLSGPIIAAVALFSSIAVLSDYVWQSLVLQLPKTQTMLVGMIRGIQDRQQGIVSLHINPLGKAFAVGVVLIIPLLIIFMVSNKYFISGVTNGGEK